MNQVASKITNTLKRISSPKTIIFFFLLAMISLNIINGKPYGTAQLLEITGGVNIPDVEMSGYSPQRAYDILTAQGEAGRAFYLRYIIPQDVLLPLLYALFYAITLTWLAQRLFLANHFLQGIGLVGLCAGLADWGENLCLLILLLNYPQRLDMLARIASIFTVVKTGLSLLSMGLILIGVIWLFAQTVRTKISTKT